MVLLIIASVFLPYDLRQKASGNLILILVIKSCGDRLESFSYNHLDKLKMVDQMAIMEISIIPIGSKKPSISNFVAEAVKVLKKEGAKYEVTSMGTIVEGDLEKLFYLARKMHDAVIGKGVARIVTTIKIDDRIDKPLSMAGKVKSVQEKLK